MSGRGAALWESLAVNLAVFFRLSPRYGGFEDFSSAP